MTLLVISPDYASHYTPLMVLARSARGRGQRVIVATGPSLRDRVLADGFEWRLQRLGENSNDGVVRLDPTVDRFFEATRDGPIATLRLQARDRAADLLWRPVEVGREIATLCDELAPDQIVVDHVSFGSTLALYAADRPFVTVVPGHPTQLPVASERYGVPPRWPQSIRPDPADLTQLHDLVDAVTDAFTHRWNEALAELAPDRPPAADAFRVHGERVLFNSIVAMQDPERVGLPRHHHFVGPLVRDESLPPEFTAWTRSDSTRRCYVALGTFLSHRDDVLARIAEALRATGSSAAIATGATPVERLGDIPDDWVVAPTLPQVALLRHADLAIHHGGNNSVQEATAAGVRQLALPFSTDQFANAADLERTGAGLVASPNDSSSAALATMIDESLGSPPPTPVDPLDDDQLFDVICARIAV